MHEEMLERLSAYADGDLDAAERKTIEAHLEECADCRAARDDLASLKAMASGVAISPQPETEAIWSGVRRALAEDRATQRPSRWRWLGEPALAWSVAAMALSMVLVLILVGSPMKRASNPLDRARGEYLAAISRLEAASSAASQKLPVKTQAKLLESLAVVDRAIGDCERALIAAPQDPDGQQLLLSMYDEKVRILSSTIQAASEGEPR